MIHKETIVKLLFRRPIFSILEQNLNGFYYSLSSDNLNNKYISFHSMYF